VAAAGTLVAAVLAGSWREPVEPWTSDAETLEALQPLLLHGGVAALAWRRLRATALAGSPPCGALHQAYRLQVLHDGVHEDQVARAFRRLRDAGVEPVLGKGWAAARLYPDVGLRPYGDVDLYVHAAEHAAARQAVLTARDAAPIDLHRGFGELDDRSAPTIVERSTRHAVGGIEVRTFGAEDHLRLLCLHALRHGLLRPLWLCDIAAGLEHRTASFDWDLFLAGDPLRTRWAVAAIGLAHVLLGARLDGVPIADRARRLPAWLTPSVLREWGAGRPPQGARERIGVAFRNPRRLLGALRVRWPNAVEATVGVRGSFDAWPRLPYQLAECVRRVVRFAAPSSVV
jgi:hypothetical protein